MKRFVLTLLAGCVMTALAQVPYLERRITITLQNETLEASLKKISLEGGFIFSYNPDIFDLQEPVTYRFVNRSVREVLDEIFKGKIQYKVRGKYVILTAAVPPASGKKTSGVVSGYVVDESTGERLKDVSIYDPLTLVSTLTDSYGYFEIKVDRPPSEVILSVNREHYADTVFVVPEGNRLLRVPIRVSKEKISVLADTVNQKLKRFWQKRESWFSHINLWNVDDTLSRRFQVSFVPYVGTNHKLSAHVANDFSLNVLGGYSLAVRRMEVGGLFNLVRGDVTGAQVAGLFNGVGGDMTGLQVAGLWNGNEGRSSGMQVAGVMNLNAEDAAGFSVAGVSNIASGDHAPGQVAGVFNVARAPASLQIAGVFNAAAAEVTGTQIAGVFNVAGKETKGAQIAGVFNFAPKVSGLQIGLINIADTVSGMPLGFMSLVRKGYHKIEVSADEVFYNNVSFRTGVLAFHNIFTVGAKPSTYADEQTIWTFGYGVGSTARISRRLFFDIDITSNQIVAGNSLKALNLLNKVYLGLDIQLFRKLSLNVGATLNGHVTERGYDAYPELFTDYQPTLWVDRDVGRHHHFSMWLGGKVGLRFL